MPSSPTAALAPPDPHCADLLAFLGSSPTPFHAVESAARRLAARGFRRIDEGDSWQDLAPGGYWLQRDDSSLVAFALPEGRALRAFRLIGAHTDSPNLRLKPHAAYDHHGYQQLGVEVYGGVLLNSWLDRDLALAGRVILRGAHGGAAGALQTRLVTLDGPRLRVPQLAIHLDREVNDKGLVLNKQHHMVPVLGLADAGAPSLAARCAAALGLGEDDILGTDLMLYDTLAPALGGAAGEFVFSARLDNLGMSHAAVSALAGSVAAGAASGPAGIVPVIALFDHEEIGSESQVGAGSPLVLSVLQRLALRAEGGVDLLHRALAASVFISADMSHAIHPNYADKSESRHAPVIDGGPVIKINTQQRYATTVAGAALFEALCREVDVPVQRYVHRTDLGCGSTIGPITSARLGVRTIDVGNPMLSMHSIREMAGSRDHGRMVKVLTRFLQLEEA